MRLEQMEISEWETLLPDSGFGVFHTAEGLRVLEKHAPGDLQLFAGFNGQELVGLFPVFIKEKLNVRVVLSPPPGYGVRELGPLVFSSSPKRRKRETLNKQFIERIIDAVDADNETTLFRTSVGPYYRDIRPFKWAGFDTYPTYTYQLALETTTPSEVLESFSKSLRRDIRSGETSSVTVQLGDGISDIANIYESIERRYDEQQKEFLPSQEYIVDTVDTLGERAKVYTAESADGEFLSGIIVLYSNDTAYFWKGGTGRSDHGFSINSLLHWRIINDIIRDETGYDIQRYDFHTANNERIVEYKSKFNAELVPHYRIESAGLPMTLAKKAYRTLVQ